jgi:hypothetical protein
MSADHALPRAAATALVVIAGCRGAGGPKLTLRYHPPAGATYHYALDQLNAMRLSGRPPGGTPFERKLALHLHYTQVVHGPAPGGVAVTVTFDSTWLEAPGLTDPGLQVALDRLRGMKSEVVYDDRMQVLSAAFSGGERASSPASEQIAASVKATALLLPAGPVGVGDSWVTEHELPVAQQFGTNGAIKSRTKLTMKEIVVAGADTSVRLAVETTFPGDPVALTLQGRAATVRLSGGLRGEQVYSLTRGTQVRTSMGGTMTIAVHAGATGASTIVATQQTALLLTGAQ